MSVKKVFSFEKPNNGTIALKKFVQYSLNKNRAVIYARGRSDVTGSGAKKRRQKGSGRARMSDGFAPHFRGGGVAFGPNGRKHQISINKKEKNCALKEIFYNKLENNLLLVEKNLDFKDISTKNAKKWIDENFKREKAHHKILFIDNGFSENFIKSVRNIPNVHTLEFNGLNALSIVKSTYCILSNKALEAINNRMAK